MNALSDTEYVEGATDYRLMRRGMVEAVLSLPEYNRFTKGIFSWVGFKTKWIPYVSRERAAGETKWSFSKLLRYSIDGMMAFSTKPLALSSILGVISCAIAIITLLVTVVKTLIFGNPVAGYPTIVSLILLVGGALDVLHRNARPIPRQDLYGGQAPAHIHCPRDGGRPEMTKRARYTLILGLALTAAAFFALNCMTPFYADDYSYMFTYAADAPKARITNLYELWLSQLNHYKVMNGRAVVHTLVQLFLMGEGRMLFNICNTLVFLGLGFAAYGAAFGTLKKPAASAAAGVLRALIPEPARFRAELPLADGLRQLYVDELRRARPSSRFTAQTPLAILAGCFAPPGCSASASSPAGRMRTPASRP